LADILVESEQARPPSMRAVALPRNHQKQTRSQPNREEETVSSHLYCEKEKIKSTSRKKLIVKKGKFPLSGIRPTASGTRAKATPENHLSG
jgi:hypothetical protein